jgi:deoxyribodipyrimidine photo-lyase
MARFVLDPRLEKSCGRRRLQFPCDSRRQVRKHLDGRLFVTRGRPGKRLPAIAKEIGAAIL